MIHCQRNFTLSFLFVAAPSVASMAWTTHPGSLDHGSRIAYFIALFLYFSLVFIGLVGIHIPYDRSCYCNHQVLTCSYQPGDKVPSYHTMWSSTLTVTGFVL
ncbi:hypothetical protein H5410_012793 [Solanum commersonii]|uniref:Uncharacterized protein n=1 Tax=Solanum commersonii TaxID=4109 RepID=A0A9J6ATV3_SOLCO|nr:hypothetical protein H5410_012793 [Solanum commersonii]